MKRLTAISTTFWEYDMRIPHNIPYIKIKVAQNREKSSVLYGSNPYWEDASEAEEFNPIKHSYIYKINGKYCFVDETFGTSSGGSSGKKRVSYTGRGFHITPLQGGLGPVLTKDAVTVESGNTQPYMYCELDEFHEDDIANRIKIRICCVISDTDWYDNWDSVSEEQKMGKGDADALVKKYKRYEARASYLCVPDGEGGITKIECTQM